ncbi:LLM class F420-dependent oxidoreductase [Kineococcus sp. NPDC059986]|uniref:LLM class F420-dependent oxidoreductase n=1 Tax=Kineococcus sp. NPDC059986 TaxID=3155538 RepID=UPI00344C30CD
MDLRIFTEPQQGATYETLRRVAVTAEEAGFSAFFRSDHYLTMGGDGLPGPTDAWTTLAGLARDTSTIRLGTLVSSATFRYPGLLAIQVAQVDEMSGGRVELGLGSGWYEEEHTAYGIPFPSVGERFDRFEEQLAVVTGLWGTPPGERFSFEGEHYRLTDSPALPKPVQDPVPVVLGGSARKRGAALAARYAHEFNAPFSSPAETAERFERVRAACSAVGRDPGTMTFSAALLLVCGRDEAEFTRRAEAIGRAPEEVRENGIAGTVSEVVDAVGRYAEAGVERLYLQVMDLSDLAHLELVAAEVAPQL